MTDLLVEARHLAYRYHDRYLLAPLDVDLAKGGILGVIGPNGAGKSTLIRLLAGILKPSEGQIIIKGTPLEALPRFDFARLVSVVNPREPLPPFPMTVWQYVLLGRLPYQNWLGQVTESDEAIGQQALAQSKIVNLRELYVHQISSGEWQKVQLARALAQTPELLLLDEPTAYLDINAQISLMRLLQETATLGLEVIIVLHDLNLAAQFCDQLLLLQAGKKVACGSPVDVLNAQHLEQVYGESWSIQVDDTNQRPVIIPRYHL